MNVTTTDKKSNTKRQREPKVINNYSGATINFDELTLAKLVETTSPRFLDIKNQIQNSISDYFKLKNYARFMLKVSDDFDPIIYENCNDDEVKGEVCLKEKCLKYKNCLTIKTRFIEGLRIRDEIHLKLFNHLLSFVEKSLFESISQDDVDKIVELFSLFNNAEGLPEISYELQENFDLIRSMLNDRVDFPNADFTDDVIIRSDESLLLNILHQIGDIQEEACYQFNKNFPQEIEKIHTALINDENPEISVDQMHKMGVLFDRISQGKDMMCWEIPTGREFGIVGTFEWYTDQEAQAVAIKIEDIISHFDNHPAFFHYMSCDSHVAFIRFKEEFFFICDEKDFLDDDLFEEEANATIDVSDQWPDPIALNSVKAPEIPCNLFPTPLSDFIVAASEFTQTPPELAMSVTLAAVSAVAQGKFRVFIRDGYTEPVNIYSLVALAPGERKSPVFNLAMKPIVEWEERKARSLKDTIAVATSRRMSSEKKISHMRALYAKELDSVEAENIQIKIEALEKKLKKIPTIPRIFCADVTPEALGAIMKDQDERIAIMSDEGGVFETICGRYSNGIPNLDLILQGHPGTPVRIDRKGTIQDPIFLNHPSITLNLTVQPSVIRDLKKKPELFDRGLVARCFYFLPQSRLGSRTIESPDMPYSVLRRYNMTIEKILEKEWNTDDNERKIPYDIELSEEAYQVFFDFSDEVEMKLKPNAEYEMITGWAGKLPGASIRIAGLFHIADNIMKKPFPDQISGEIMSNAVEVSRMLSDHFFAAFSLMTEDVEIEYGRKILKWIKHRSEPSFNRGRIHQSMKKSLRRMANIKTGLGVLIEHGYLREQKAGNKTSAYLVHPSVIN